MRSHFPRALALIAFAVLTMGCKTATQKCAGGDLDACKSQCDKNETSACFNASAMYLLGKHGAPQDDAKAVEYKNRACSLGDLNACEELGVFYKNGFHAPTDIAKARVLLQKACDGGVPTACTSLRGLPRTGG